MYKCVCGRVRVRVCVKSLASISFRVFLTAHEQNKKRKFIYLNRYASLLCSQFPLKKKKKKFSYSTKRRIKNSFKNKIISPSFLEDSNFFDGSYKALTPHLNFSHTYSINTHKRVHIYKYIAKIVLPLL